MIYIHDLNETQLSDKEIMHSIICSLIPEAVKGIVAIDVKIGSPITADDKRDLIGVWNEIKDSIEYIFQ